MARCLMGAVLVLGTIFAAAEPAAGQDRGPFGIEWSAGLATPTAIGGFAEAYDKGTSIGAAIGIRASSALTLHASVEYQDYPYDRARFFRALGHDVADLDTQLGASASILALGLGARYKPWPNPYMEPFVSGAIGHANRGSDNALLALYCTRPSFVIRDGVITFPTDWTEPEACEPAREETRIESNGPFVELALGVMLWRNEHLGMILEAGYTHAFLQPRAGLLTPRVGFTARF